MNNKLKSYLIVVVILYVLPFIVYLVLGYFFCNIEPNETYSWYFGLWHGFFVLANMIFSLFDNTLYKATDPSIAYYIFYVIGIFLVVLIFQLINAIHEASINTISKKDS